MISDAKLDALLAEDVPFGDLTTAALGIGAQEGRISFAARGAMIVCCVEEAERLLDQAGARTHRHAASGNWVEAGTVLLEADGPAAALHRVWKTAQTLMEYASGIASAVGRIVEAARAMAPAVQVECTRKAFPGTRAIAVRAVHAGGGQMHRLGLSESILVFPEHLVFLGCEDEALTRIATLKRHHPGRKLTAETGSVDQAEALARAGIDIVQLERLSPSEARRVLERTASLTPRPMIAVAGGVNESNAGAYAAAGCDILVTSAPYFARPADVRVRIEAMP